MAEAQYSHNHIVNPSTGFLENPAFVSAFDSDKKSAFLDAFPRFNLRIRRTCDALGVSVDTVNRHYQVDPVFKKAMDDVKARYLEDLEGVARENALNPKSVIERIFLLKCLLPDKYGQENKPPTTQITINIGGSQLDGAIESAKILDADTVE